MINLNNYNWFYLVFKYSIYSRHKVGMYVVLRNFNDIQMSCYVDMKYNDLYTVKMNFNNNNIGRLCTSISRHMNDVKINKAAI